MDLKRYRGKFLTFQFPRRKQNISGIVLGYNEAYTFIRRCHDYQLDGYTIFKNDKAEFVQGDFEKRAARILKLKNYLPEKEAGIPIDTLDNMLMHIGQQYQLIQLDTPKGDASDIVAYIGKVGRSYHFDELTTNAKWRFKLELPERECRFISFDNDYLNSLKLITNFKKKKSGN
jgi:hypothetical protein